MHLNELAVPILGSRLERATDCTSGANHRHRRPAEDQPASAGRQNEKVGGKGADLHRDKILSHTPATTTCLVENGSQKVPELELADPPRDFPSPYLFIQGIQQLLARRRTGERRPFVEGSSETATIQETLGCAVERHP